MFPPTAFGAESTSRLTGISEQQLDRWHRSGFFRPSFPDRGRRDADYRVYSYGDVIELRTLGALRDRGVSLPQLALVRRFFAQHKQDAWANQRFYVVGRQIFLTAEDAELAARSRTGRPAIAVVELGPIVAEIDRAIDRLGDRTPNEIGKIVRDRLIMRGAPVIAGTRIPTATIDWFVREGYTLDDILRNFPRLTPFDVEAAVAFERQLRDGTSQRLRATR